MGQWHTLNKRYFSNDEYIHETLINTDRNGNLINTFGGSSNLPLSAGQVDGHSVLNIFGYSSVIGTSDFVPAWENTNGNGNCTPYTYPSQGLIMDISSDSDDEGFTIRIVGLDSSYKEIYEDIVLNASGSQTTQKSFYRINKMITIGIPSGAAGGNPANNVTISESGVVYALMRGGEGQNQASIYTVPENHMFFLTRIDGFSATSTSDTKYLIFRNYVRLSTGVEYRVAETTFLRNMSIMRQAPFPYDEKTDIQLQVKSASSDQEVGLFAEGVLVNKDYLI